jgi:hypothetical protein
MNVSDFVDKWRESELKETASFQTFFDDLCRLVGHPTPSEIDPTGKYFTYEKHVTKTRGGKGFADAWYKGHFAWEHKGKHKNLDEAYQQLLQYREDLENPPLLVVSDFEQIIIHTNFTNTSKRTHEVHLVELPNGMDVLEALFFQPELLKPAQSVPEAPAPKSIRPQLSLRFDVLESPRVYSDYGLVYAGGGGACPAVEGHASLGLILVSNSRGRSAKYIKAELNVRLLRSTRPECRRDFYVPTTGWCWSETGDYAKHFRFDGGSDDVCIHEDELSLGRVEFRLVLPKDAVDFQNLVQETDDSQTRTLLELQFNSPTQFPQMTTLRERLLGFYGSNPAEDSYKLMYKVSAEGFEQFGDEVSVSITWSRHMGRMVVE